MSQKTDPNAKDPEKTVDVPPYGPRNPDPLTDAPGSHPLETGVGAVLGGAATGATIGIAIGPAGVVLGIIAGGIAGGLAGKGIGELIDPTTEDNWIHEWLAERRRQDELDEEKAGAAYRFGIRAEARHPHQTFDEAEDAVRAEWEAERTAKAPKDDTTWSDVDGSVRAGFERMHNLRTGL
jgi:hypothetical protein